MKEGLLLFLCFQIGIAGAQQSQNNALPQHSREKASWVYNYASRRFAVADRKGNARSEFIYENPEPFQDSIARARVNSQYVLLDTNGKEIGRHYDYLIATAGGHYVASMSDRRSVVLDARGRELFYRELRPREYLDFIDNDTLFWYPYEVVYFQGKQGLIDRTERLLLPALYDGIRDVSDDSATVYSNGVWQRIRFPGKKATKTELEPVIVSSGALTNTNQADKWKFADPSGRLLVLRPLSGFATDCRASGIAADRQHGEWVFFDSTGKRLSPFGYTDLYDFAPGIRAAQRGGLWGFIDEHCREIVPPRYQFIDKLQKGLAIVRRDNRYGYVDSTGMERIAPKYEDCRDFFEGRAAVQADKLWGYVSDNGSLVIAPQFNEANDFSEGLACVLKDRLWGFIDTSGAVAVPFRFEDGKYFTEGLAPVRAGDAWGFTDRSGTMVIEPQFSACFYGFQKGIAVVKKDDRFFLINKKGEPVLTGQFTLINRIESGYYLLFRENKKGLADETGALILTPDYSDIWEMGPGRFKVEKDRHLYGVIDGKGAFLLPLEFSEIGDFYAGRSKVWVNGKTGFVDSSGKAVIPAAFDGSGYFSNGVAFVQVGRKWGLIDSLGNLLAPPQYDDAHASGINGLFWMKKADSWGLVDQSNQTILPFRYETVEQAWGETTWLDICQRKGWDYRIFPNVFKAEYISCSIFLLLQNGRYGLYAPDFGIRILPAYENIGLLDEENGWIRVQQNGKWGWVDKQGKVMIPCRYDAAAPFHGGSALVQQLPYPFLFCIDAQGKMILGTEQL